MNNPSNNGKTIWLTQCAEILPIDTNPRLMRTGLLANLLAEKGYSIYWFTSRFDHISKSERGLSDSIVEINENLSLVFLDGPGYAQNISLSRLWHHQKISEDFLRKLKNIPRPNLIVSSYPSPELCEAACNYSKSLSIPFVLDIRDLWPDIFCQYVPAKARWALYPFLCYYRKKIRHCTRAAAGILANSQENLTWGLRYAKRTQEDRDRVFHHAYKTNKSNRTSSLPIKFCSKKQLRCVFVSTFGHSYDGKTIVDSARILEERGDKRIQIDMIGDGVCRKQWEEESAGLRNIFFRGWMGKTDLEKALSSSHVGLVLIKRGGMMPNKLIEYMSFGLALINTLSGEGKDIIETNDAGITIPAENPIALADALASLASNSFRVGQLMSNSLNTFTTSFSADLIYTRYADYLEKMCNVEHNSFNEKTVSFSKQAKR